VKEITSGEFQITEGALYPLLHRLEAEGLVVTAIENIGNRVRKYYSLTKAGKRDMELNMEEIRKFLQAMNHIMKPKLA
jgi:DNA-binding PadR family transcriptional regulator